MIYTLLFLIAVSMFAAAAYHRSRFEDLKVGSGRLPDIRTAEIRSILFLIGGVVAIALILYIKYTDLF